MNGQISTKGWGSWSEFLEYQASCVTVPKAAVLVDRRLGCFLKFLELVAIVGCGVLLYFRSEKAFKTTTMDVTMWQEPPSRNVSNEDAPEPKHCSNMEAYAYEYSKDWIYNATGCRELPRHQNVVKTDKEIYFMTLLHDTDVKSASDEGMCQELEVRCPTGTKPGYTWSKWDPVRGRCSCTSRLQEYVKNPEKRILAFYHEYQVAESDDSAVTHYQEGTSETDYQTRRRGPIEERIGLKMLTRILRPDGSPCRVNGKSDWLPEDGSINGTVEEWLACSGVSMDSNETPPHVRTQGAKINLNFIYQNQHRSITGDIGVVCDLYVSARVRWNGRVLTDYTTLDAANMLGGRITVGSRLRYAYGVSFTFTRGGSFAFFDWSAFTSSLIDCIVLLGIPSLVTRVIALYGMGPISSIYCKVTSEVFHLVEEFHVVCVKMMIAAQAFRQMTGQQGKARSELHAMKRLELRASLEECLHHELEHIQKQKAAQGKATREDGKEVTGLCSKELNTLTAVVMKNLDKSGNHKEVKFDEFVSAAISNHPVTLEDLSTVFDKQDGKGCLVPVLASTMEEIDEVAEDDAEKMEGGRGTEGGGDIVPASTSQATE